MIQSTHNPKFANMSDTQMLEAYVSTYKLRNPDTMTDEELDQNDSDLFWIDDELCARGLDLPSIL